VAAYRRCLTLDPGLSEAVWSLANLKTYRFSDDELAAAQAQLADPDLPAADVANLRFSLGKHMEDRGHAAEAMDQYRRANRIEHARRAYDPNQTTALVARSKALFTPASCRARGWGDPRPGRCSLVGMHAPARPWSTRSWRATRP